MISRSKNSKFVSLRNKGHFDHHDHSKPIPAIFFFVRSLRSIDSMSDIPDMHILNKIN